VSTNRPKRRFRFRINWQRTAVRAFTWVLLAVFVMTSVGVALFTFAVR
jgi:hypothetical protein